MLNFEILGATKMEEENAISKVILDCGYRIGLLVNDEVIVELKVVENFTVEHIAQTLSYMRFSNCKLGLLLNFYKKPLKDGIKRLIL